MLTYSTEAGAESGARQTGCDWRMRSDIWPGEGARGGLVWRDASAGRIVGLGSALGSWRWGLYRILRGARGYTGLDNGR